MLKELGGWQLAEETLLAQSITPTKAVGILQPLPLHSPSSRGSEWHGARFQGCTELHPPLKEALSPLQSLEKSCEMRIRLLNLNLMPQHQ